jgi:hypothetical protein
MPQAESLLDERQGGGPTPIPQTARGSCAVGRGMTVHEQADKSETDRCSPTSRSNPSTTRGIDSAIRTRPAIPPQGFSGKRPLSSPVTAPDGALMVGKAWRRLLWSSRRPLRRRTSLGAAAMRTFGRHGGRGARKAASARDSARPTVDTGRPTGGRRANDGIVRTE